jgi:two-component system, sensor histidine kinase
MTVSIPEAPGSERVVVLAPTPRDAAVTRRLLAGAGIHTIVGQGWPHVQELVRDGVGAIVLTDLTLADRGIAALLESLDRQPGWSDLPVLALCRPGTQALALRLLGLRNLTVLDRPTSMGAMVSAVQTALRGRRWQYQIRDQIESLRVADQRKDEFLATLAHELRNPLAPIRTGLELMARLPADGARREAVMAMMDRQLNQLLRLIDDLLEIARISTGKLVLQRERLDMRHIVETALEACAPLVSRGGHRLTVRMCEQPLWVDGDPARLAQSLSNLLNNAAKYTPDGGRITITLASEGGQAVLTVEDTGVGLPADMIGRVFDMFAQVNRSLDRAQGGLGIGLALVKSLVGLHGGQVSASSPGPGLGSTFTIRLPLLEAPAAVPQPPAADMPEPAAPLRVLVVDDNQDAAESLAALLALAGHHVRVAHGGQEALDTAPDFMPHAVFCDLGMPGMDGHEFARRLRRDGRFATTLLIALTGWGAEEDQRRSRAAGFDRHLTKPASAAALAALLAGR